MTKLKTLSPHWDSVDAPCEYASYCGGCKTQNLSYEAQLRAKEGQVRDLVVHVGKFSDKDPEFAGIMKPIVPCDIQFHYRNKVSVQNKALPDLLKCDNCSGFNPSLFVFFSFKVFSISTFKYSAFASFNEITIDYLFLHGNNLDARQCNK